MTKDPIETAATNWRALYRWAGVSAILFGIVMIASVPLAIGMGAQPSGAAAVLTWLGAQTTVAYIQYGLFILGDLLLVPIVLALYLALKSVNANAMLTATGFGFLFIVLDLGVTVIWWIALIGLSKDYAAATSEVQRDAYVASANYALATFAVASPVFSFLNLSIWWLITNLVMLRGGLFSKATAYLGIIGSLAGFAVSADLFVPALSVAGVVMGVALGIWFIYAGYRLRALGSPPVDGSFTSGHPRDAAVRFSSGSDSSKAAVDIAT